MAGVRFIFKASDWCNTVSAAPIIEPPGVHNPRNAGTAAMSPGLAPLTESLRNRPVHFGTRLIIHRAAVRQKGSRKTPFHRAGAGNARPVNGAIAGVSCGFLLRGHGFVPGREMRERFVVIRTLSRTGSGEGKTPVIGGCVKG